MGLHFLYIAEAMNHIGEQSLGWWDNQDEFYDDVLNLSSGQTVPLKIRSMVGLIPLFAVKVPRRKGRRPSAPREGIAA